MFVCHSGYDASPLTPLEYIMANMGDGRTIISDLLGFKIFENYKKIQSTKELSVLPVELNYGFSASSFIFIFNDIKVAVITDTNSEIKDETIEVLNGVDVLFVDTFSEDSN